MYLTRREGTMDSFHPLLQETSEIPGRGRAYSLPEAAGILGVHEDTLRMWIHAGLLWARHDGEQWMVALPTELLGKSDPSRRSRSPTASPADSPYATLPLELGAPEPSAVVTPTEVDRDVERIARKHGVDSESIHEELAWYVHSQLATKDAEIADLWRVVEGLALDRVALEERIRAREPAAFRAGPSRPIWQFGLTHVVLAVMLGLTILLCADYFIDGDAIPLIPENVGVRVTISSGAASPAAFPCAEVRRCGREAAARRATAGDS
jgi:hypothetical protein